MVGFDRRIKSPASNKTNKLICNVASETKGYGVQKPSVCVGKSQTLLLKLSRRVWKHFCGHVMLETRPALFALCCTKSDVESTSLTVRLSTCVLYALSWLACAQLWRYCRTWRAYFFT